MNALSIAMLCVQAALALATAITIFKAGSRGGGPNYSTLALSLIMTAAISMEIREKHNSSSLAGLVGYGSGVLLGMGLLCLVIELRRRWGRDQGASAA